jgi:hypothetical protein
VLERHGVGDGFGFGSSFPDLAAGKPDGALPDPFAIRASL